MHLSDQVLAFLDILGKRRFDLGFRPVHPSFRSRQPLLHFSDRIEVLLKLLSVVFADAILKLPRFFSDRIHDAFAFAKLLNLGVFRLRGAVEKEFGEHSRWRLFPRDHDPAGCIRLARSVRTEL